MCHGDAQLPTSARRAPRPSALFFAPTGSSVRRFVGSVTLEENVHPRRASSRLSVPLGPSTNGPRARRVLNQLNPFVSAFLAFYRPARGPLDQADLWRCHGHRCRPAPGHAFLTAKSLWQHIRRPQIPAGPGIIGNVEPTIFPPSI